ncbi:hypothetical protein VB005_08113, partial [Metarhizium brunneum]
MPRSRNGKRLAMASSIIDGWLPEEWWVDEHLKFDLQNEWLMSL